MAEEGWRENDKANVVDGESGRRYINILGTFLMMVLKVKLKLRS
jgi:hypothetical protein